MNRPSPRPPPDDCSLPAREVDPPAPLLGQHNAEVLTELGFDPARIAALERDGVLLAERH